VRAAYFETTRIGINANALETAIATIAAIPQQQDALCTLSTGGGYASRQLYTNSDEHVMETKRPVMINGINAIATQPDFRFTDPYQ